ncbi:MAG: class I SAM-dependent methyltransferase [Candidatus Sumerlaeia bacterium]
MTVEYVEKVYNFYSGVYDVVFGRVFQDGRVLAPDLLDLQPDTQLLEVGIGTGLSLPLLPRTQDMTGIDLSEGMLEHARDRAVALNMPNIKLFKMDATRMDLPDDSFDRVLAAYFISTVPDPIKVVEEMKRVCRPGGRLVFINHFLSDNKFLAFWERLISPFCYRIGFYTDLNLYKLMEKCGLEIESIQPAGLIWKAVCVKNTK